MLTNCSLERAPSLVPSNSNKKLIQDKTKTNTTITITITTTSVKGQNEFLLSKSCLAHWRQAVDAWPVGRSKTKYFYSCKYQFFFMVLLFSQPEKERVGFTYKKKKKN